MVKTPAALDPSPPNVGVSPATYPCPASSTMPATIVLLTMTALAENPVPVLLAAPIVACVQSALDDVICTDRIWPGANGLRCCGGDCEKSGVKLLSTSCVPRTDATSPNKAPIGTGSAALVFPGSVLYDVGARY